MAEALNRPGPTASKHLLTFAGAAATDLGLGDQVTEELKTQIEERRKMVKTAAPAVSSPFFSSAAADLGLR